MFVLGYRCEGTTLCKKCTEGHLKKHFPMENKEEIADYLEDSCYPLFDDDVKTYGKQVFEEKCEECGSKIYSDDD